MAYQWLYLAICDLMAIDYHLASNQQCPHPYYAKYLQPFPKPADLRPIGQRDRDLVDVSTCCTRELG